MTKARKIIFISAIIFFYVFATYPQKGGQKTPDICISGMMSDKNNSLVIINNEIAKVGDTIHNMKIISITRSTVTLEYNGKTFEKRIGEGCINTPAPLHKNQITKPKQNRKSFSLFFPKSKTITNTHGFKRVLFLYGTIFILILWALILLSYAYTALCLQKVAKKTITKHDWLAWIPVANLFLLAMMARRPVWWSILFFIPLVNFIFIIILWMRISGLLNKPSWLGLLMMIPFVNLVILGYLAFSE